MSKKLVNCKVEPLIYDKLSNYAVHHVICYAMT